MNRAAWLVVSACGAPAMPAIDAGGDAMRDAGPTHLVVYASGNGAPISWYRLDAGTLAPIGSVPPFAANPSFVALTPDGRFAYAIAEGADRVGGYRVGADGSLTFINDVAVGGNGPAHVAVDRAGHFVLAASYGDGAVSVFPISADGRLGNASQTLNAGKNAHQIVIDAANKFAFVPCLGSDYVAQYAFDAATGTLTANAVPHLATAAKAGPRHLAFAPDGTHAYLIDELDSTLTALAYDPALGRLTALETVSTLQAPVAGNSGAEVQVHPSGKYVYTSNRGDDSIATFSVAADGRVTAMAWTKTGGKTPRHFSLSPDGAVLVVGNQQSNTIQAMAIDASGVPARVGTAVTFTAPELVQIVAQPGS